MLVIALVAQQLIGPNEVLSPPMYAWTASYKEGLLVSVKTAPQPLQQLLNTRGLTYVSKMPDGLEDGLLLGLDDGLLHCFMVRSRITLLRNINIKHLTTHNKSIS